ncbi:small, acid-soluble spore protein H [Clostridium acetireducens DSM 10703]|jgi:small acid-soluble spore protein H (minor)|uniref:Small, acid-soluble spore protein H n=1 Tax=Clostridium acetireducens DSM 10703 TaxID=1121290 RepID=A0A1E8EY78_9CLOT|nr:H-type small acid-soluble spore protein [Clostridium acetireducens]OFI05914.1 small, acid-soluble spore protein H [Clostridium acetireducens DSM 10703]
MNIKRANEIFQSLGVIDVEYKGNPVWIENVIEENNEVVVKNLETKNKFTVNVFDLKEI